MCIRDSRYAGHSPSDASSYRTKDEMAAWQAVDPLITYRAQLIEAGVATEAECDAIKAVSYTHLSSGSSSVPITSSAGAPSSAHSTPRRVTFFGGSNRNCLRRISSTMNAA